MHHRGLWAHLDRLGRHRWIKLPAPSSTGHHDATVALELVQVRKDHLEAWREPRR